MKRVLLIAGLTALGLSSSSLDNAATARLERLASAQASLKYMEDFVAAPGYKDCATPFLQAEDKVRAAIEEGLLLPDTRIPELIILRLAEFNSPADN